MNVTSETNRELPIGWDCNAKGNAFEIVDEGMNPVFQLTYRRPNEVQIGGVFSSGDQVMVLNQEGWVAKRIKGDSPVTLPAIKPFFKYPSWVHSGEYAE
jgi:hypothetical protein